MDSKQQLIQSRQSAGTTSPASGLAMKHRWIAGVLDEMQQANAVIEKRFGRSRAMWRGETRSVSAVRAA